MKFVSVAEMRAIEQEANRTGLSYEEMMENAGGGLAGQINNAYSHLGNRRVLGLIGPGNNGGDTLIALIHLAESGWKTTAYLALPRPENDPLLVRYISTGGEYFAVADDPGFTNLSHVVSQNDIILDGILGTGAHLPLKPEILDVLECVNRSLQDVPEKPLMVAVDCPTGVDSDSGDADPNTIKADWTICMAAVKLGLLRLPAYAYVGDFRVVDIGFTGKSEVFEQIHREVASPEMIRGYLPERLLDAHKGTFGTDLIVAGSINYTGAVLLAGRAAYLSGAGLVTLGVPSAIQEALAGQLIEATWLLLPNDQGVISEDAAGLVLKRFEKVDALLLGPGWGMEETTGAFLGRLIHGEEAHKRGQVGFVPRKTDKTAASHLPPMVVDADGLKLLARIENWPELLPENTILTPHPGEMSVLTGLSTNEIQSNRHDIAEKYAKKWGKVIVLKGAFTVVADLTGHSVTIPVATPALAKAGTGDVLAGMIVSLLGQHVPPFKAAIAGAWLHAQAGLIASELIGNNISVMASDVIEAIPEALNILSEPL